MVQVQEWKLSWQVRGEAERTPSKTETDEWWTVFKCDYLTVQHMSWMGDWLSNTVLIIPAPRAVLPSIHILPDTLTYYKQFIIGFICKIEGYKFVPPL